LPRWPAKLLGLRRAGDSQAEQEEAKGAGHGWSFAPALLKAG